jgi:hypothetical protein
MSQFRNADHSNQMVVVDGACDGKPGHCHEACRKTTVGAPSYRNFGTCFSYNAKSGSSAAIWTVYPNCDGEYWETDSVKHKEVIGDPRGWTRVMMK